MKLDYGTQLSPLSISLSVGPYNITIRKPTLRDIAKISFGKFAFYESLLDMTPEEYYEDLLGDTSKLNSMTSAQKDNYTIYDVIKSDYLLCSSYVEMFNFFIVGKVIFDEGCFFIVDDDCNLDEGLTEETINGVINPTVFPQIANVIMQICGIEPEQDEAESEMKFKNEAAKKLYARMKDAKRKSKRYKKSNINLTLPNIISSVANRHPSINPINIWDMTVYQLIDAFQRLQVLSVYDIDATRVSVWGDEKKKFDPALWYKNEYDHQ